ncbi:hypothetical protein EYC84_011502 [Monilinia fructicola]|uniref:Uncharacterized protein n=1 Tax=Monilinia fructicola TaxID=38448 RepID=A0A5M9J711_MONFR|nr:hypothetical protein EYC84_011502 [Monilinia fructicola]
MQRSLVLYLPATDAIILSSRPKKSESSSHKLFLSFPFLTLPPRALPLIPSVHPTSIRPCVLPIYIRAKTQSSCISRSKKAINRPHHPFLSFRSLSIHTSTPNQIYSIPMIPAKLLSPIRPYPFYPYITLAVNADTQRAKKSRESTCKSRWLNYSTIGSQFCLPIKYTKEKYSKKCCTWCLGKLYNVLLSHTCQVILLDR